MVPTLVVDLDGTLVDSVADLAAALNRLLGEYGQPAFSEHETARFVGDGVAKLVERGFAARGLAAGAADIAAFSADYGRNFAHATRPYPGAAAALGALAGAGWRLCVCTNKPAAAARALLEAVGCAGLFAAVGGGDSFPVRKPDPAHLLATLREAGGHPGRAVMIGDNANDVRAAHGAGLPCIFAGWGYGTPAMAEGSEAVAAQWEDVPPIADRLVARS